MSINYYFFIPIYILIFIMIYYLSNYLNLVDKPNIRKKHKVKSFYTGGICIALAFYLSIKFFSFEINLSKIFLYSSIFLILGFIDDYKSIKAGNKLLWQIFIIYILINQGFVIQDLGKFNFGMLTLGEFGFVFTFICALLIINSFNYSDGIDHLASSIFITTIFSLFLINEKILLENLDFFINLLLILIIFSFFNKGIFLRYKIFLGNGGSMMLGCFLAFLCIYVTQISKYIHPSQLVWSLAYLVFEFNTIFINRILLKKKITKPGRDHLHYIFLEIGFKKTSVLFFINFLIIFFHFTGNLIFTKFGPLISLIFFILFQLIYFLFWFKLSKWK